MEIRLLALVTFLVLITFGSYHFLYTGNAFSGDFGATSSNEDCVSRVEKYTVSGSSMSPYLHSGDSIYAYIGYYDCNFVLKGDMVLVDFSWRDRPIIKFVRGVSGDRFEFKETESGTILLVNGEPVSNFEGETYLFSGRRKEMLELYMNDYGGELPPDSYLLLGNQVTGSFDSTKMGLVRSENIVAKAVKA